MSNAKYGGVVIIRMRESGWVLSGAKDFNAKSQSCQGAKEYITIRFETVRRGVGKPRNPGLETCRPDHYLRLGDLASWRKSESLVYGYSARRIRLLGAPSARGWMRERPEFALFVSLRPKFARVH